MTDGLRVVLGRDAARSGPNAGRGIGRSTQRLAVALEALAPAVVCEDAGRGTGAGCDELVYHVMSPVEPGPLERVYPSWVRRVPHALVATLYDLIALDDLERHLPLAAARRRYLQRLELYRAADLVFANSAATADDGVRRLGLRRSRVHCVGSAPGIEIAPPGAEPRSVALERVRARQRSLRPSFLFAVLGDSWHKNAAALLDAYGGLPTPLRQAHQLVIAGCVQPGGRAALASAANEHRLAVGRDVVLLEHVGDAEMGDLYRACELLVHPTLGEGFGKPVLEALLSGTAAIVSDLPALRELVPDAEARFDPSSAAAIRAALVSTLSSPQRLQAWRAAGPRSVAGYTWEDVARRALDGYAIAAAVRRRPRGVRPSQPPRLALVTPWPPARSGVSKYSARLAEALAARVALDVYADNAGSESVLRATDYAWRQELDRPAARTLVCLGNSRFHSRGWQLLMRYGGDVLLHEAMLADLHAELARTPWARGMLPAQPDLLAAVVRRADRVLVHTADARALALAACPERRADVHVVPFGFPPPSQPAPPAQPRVVSFGYVKHGRLLVEATARLLQVVPEATVAFVGAHPDPCEERRIRAHERALGVRVEHTGWLDERELSARLATTTVAVQLRPTFYGEASGALADCLAAGVPTIVNAGPTNAELAGDVVERLASEPTAGEVAGAIARLLADPARRAELGDNGRAHARAHGFERAAAAVLEHLWEFV